MKKNRFRYISKNGPETGKYQCRKGQKQMLLQLTVDTGIDTRTVVSGIAQQYSPETWLVNGFGIA